MRSLLTLPGVFGDSGVPQTVIGVTDAFPVPVSYTHLTLPTILLV